MARFKRILLKLSGESLMGKQGYGIDAERLALEPLRLRCGDEPCTSGLRVEAEQRVEIDPIHELYCK